MIAFVGDLFTDFADVLASAHQEGANVVLSIDADTSLTLRDTQIDSLSADDFRFG